VVGRKQRLRREFAQHDAGDRRGQAEVVGDREIDRAAIEVLADRVESFFAHNHADCRVFAPQARKNRRYAIGRQILETAEHELAAGCRIVVRERFQRLDLGQHFLRLGHHGLAERGQRNAVAALAHEHLAIEAFLDLRDGHRDRRLRDMHRLRRRREAAMTRCSDRVLHLPERELHTFS
jgi:hypothetical protein